MSPRTGGVVQTYQVYYGKIIGSAIGGFHAFSSPASTSCFSTDLGGSSWWKNMHKVHTNFLGVKSLQL